MYACWLVSTAILNLTIDLFTSSLLGDSIILFFNVSEMRSNNRNTPVLSQTLRRNILNVLSESNDWLALDIIADRIGLKRPQIQSEVRVLLKAGLIVSSNVSDGGVVFQLSSKKEIPLGNYLQDIKATETNGASHIYLHQKSDSGYNSKYHMDGNHQQNNYDSENIQICDFFSKARNSLGLPVDDIARLVNIDAGQILRFESGAQGVSIETMEKLMRALSMSFNGPGISCGEAFGYPLLHWGDISDFIHSGKHNGRRLRAADPLMDGAFWVEVPTDLMVSNHAPSFAEGSFILIDRTKTELENRGFYLFYIKEENEYVFRQYIRQAGIGYLRPLKTACQNLKLTSRFVVIGRIVDSRQAL